MCTTRLGIAGSRTDSRRYVGLWVGMILKFILALIFHTLVIVAASAEVARKPTLSGTVTDAETVLRNPRSAPASPPMPTAATR